MPLYYLLITSLLLGGLPHRALADGPQAVEHYERAMSLFENQQFAEALAAFEHAFEYDPSPILLYNIAECHRQLGHRDLAIDAYQRYLALSPQAEDRGVVEARIADLSAEEDVDIQTADEVVTQSAPPTLQVAPSPGSDPPVQLVQVAPDERPHPASQRDQDPDSIWTAPWLWAGIGSAVVGGVVLGLVLGNSKSSSPAEPVAGSVGEPIYTQFRF